MRHFLLALAIVATPAFAQGEAGAPPAEPEPTSAETVTEPAAAEVAPQAPATWRFEPRAAARAGWRFQESSTWTVTGSNVVKVGGATVRKGPVDRLTSHRVLVDIVEVKDGRPHVFDVTIAEQVSREDGDLEELDLDGVALRVAGAPGSRGIERVDGKRLKRKQKKWLQRQFGGSPDGEDFDPVEILIPDRELTVGETWDLSLDRIQAYFGEERFVLDRDASWARATLVSVDPVDGVDVGTFSFDVLIVPSSMRDAEFTEARMAVIGTAKLPVPGDVPWFEYDVDTTLRYLGTFSRGAIKANVDLDMSMDGIDARRAVE